MTTHLPSLRNPRAVFGAVSVEYLLVMLLAGVVLLSGQPSLVSQLLSAMAGQLRLFAVLVALP